MFDKNKLLELYTRIDYSFAERLYEEYMLMRNYASKYEGIKYSQKDTFINSKEGREGFIAGVHIMLSLMADL